MRTFDAFDTFLFRKGQYIWHRVVKRIEKVNISREFERRLQIRQPHWHSHHHERDIRALPYPRIVETAATQRLECSANTATTAATMIRGSTGKRGRFMAFFKGVDWSNPRIIV